MSTSDSAVCDLVPPQTRARPHIGYLDGIRGLAALYVLISHVQGCAFQLVTANGLLMRIAGTLDYAVLGFGHFAVDVFIVLSGYCLMLPVAARPQGTLSGGFWGFFKRRFRRIVPPYLAALFVSIVVNYVTPPSGTLPSGAELLSHLLLVHNLGPWHHAINGPMWSVAVEWQIYFVFALLLLPVWRRFGAAASILFGFTVGLLPHFLLASSMNWDWSCPWYIGLFALGMCAAAGQGKRRSDRASSRPIPWGLAALAALSAALGMYFFLRAGWEHVHWMQPMRRVLKSSPWLPDVAIGVSATSLLLYLAAPANHSNRLRSFLEHRLIERLALMSYSLYLIHLPFVYLVYILVKRAAMPQLVGYVLQIVVGLPVGLLAGWMLYQTVERRFQSRPAARPALPLEVPGSQLAAVS
ncbi:MAG TPA: acyltransferase [Humisphaera sp.]|jgi:peptidoglycan/LPS O-acetylase OafA/YrhL|nr:acyltransferase [Humisphaera sp.]